jgi:hypothetical protein
VLELGNDASFISSLQPYLPITSTGPPYHLRPTRAHLYHAQIPCVVITSTLKCSNCTCPSTRHAPRFTSLVGLLFSRPAVLRQDFQCRTFPNLQGTTIAVVLRPSDTPWAFSGSSCCASRGPLVPCCRALLVCTCSASGIPYLYPFLGTH